MGNVVRFRKGASKPQRERAAPSVAADIAAGLQRIAAALADEIQSRPPNASRDTRTPLPDKGRTHRTIKGELVRSKSELAIANILCMFEREGRLTYRYEPRLPFTSGEGRWADFAIEAHGQIWFWEHCGMLSDDDYRQRWEVKRELYEKNGYSVYSARNLSGRLIVTEESPQCGLDTKAIDDLVQILAKGHF